MVKLKAFQAFTTAEEVRARCVQMSGFTASCVYCFTAITECTSEEEWQVM